MMLRSLKTACISAAFFCLLSCSKQAKEPATADEIHFEVEPAPAWTALFKRSQGWFGGDGIFAIPFSGVDGSGTPGDSILFLFSDTMHGEIKDTVLQPGFSMVNNSVMVLKGKEADPNAAKFLINEKDKKPFSLFVPSTPKTEKGDYYWLGDGLIDHAADTALYIFAYRIKNTNDGTMFPFREEGGTLIAIPHNSKFPFSDQRQVDLPFPSQQQDPQSTSFGAGVLVNTTTSGVPTPDGYIYVYGVRGKAKELIAARIKPGSLENFSSWEFRSGDGWSGDLKTATGLEDSVSNELSVTPIGDNQYALVYQYGGIMPTIYMQVGPTPFGPFGSRMKVWDTSKDIQGEHLFTYNAKAHPAISRPGELLVSYNVNSFKFDEQIKKIPDLYRPRFVKIIFNKK
jgi:hypothetical protein